MKNELINLGFTLAISALVWRYYKSRSFPLYDRFLTFGPRFWAGWVDQLVTWPLRFLVVCAATLHMSQNIQIAVLILESVVLVTYTIAMHAKYGQTIGKMVCKVRVVDFKTGNPVSVVQAVIRDGIPAILTVGLVVVQVREIITGHQATEEIARGTGGALSYPLLLVAVPALWSVAELITMMTNDKRRALHDFIAGTVVVRTNIYASTQLDSPGAMVNDLQVM
jgi:uncharacterized RDD family membrane protein YckC